jgi:DNA-binding IscR family transcriptional regulator
VDNAGHHARERGVARASWARRRVLALAVAALCARRFARGEAAPTGLEVADALEAPVRLVNQVLAALERAGLVAAVRRREADVDAWVPAREPARTRLSDVAAALDHDGEEPGEAADDGALAPVAARWQALEEHLQEAAENLDLASLADRLPAPAAGRPT